MASSSSACSDYQYEPLISPEVIRVIILAPAVDHEAPLSCSIVQYDILAELSKPDNCRHYSAVSYVWGKPDYAYELRCDDQTFLRISSNVEGVLRQLRGRDEPQYLWVDAICLNQADDEEKSLQIPRMGDIYHHARLVHVWLGDDNTGNAARLFAFLRACALVPEDYATPTIENVIRGLTISIFGSAEWSHLSALLENPWFSRRWIL
jgi:hypothetical protein